MDWSSIFFASGARTNTTQSPHLFLTIRVAFLFKLIGPAVALSLYALNHVLSTAVVARLKKISLLH